MSLSSRRDFCVKFLINLFDPGIPVYPVESLYDFLSRKNKIKKSQYRQSLRGLARRGHIEILKKNQKEFIKLTKKGALKVLLEKAKISRASKWDGKWRVLIFDIPEDSRKMRDQFRGLLKQNNFVELQKSVFISPYPLSRYAVIYLNKIRLIKFVRIMKVEEMDNDKDLRSKFNL